MDGDSRRRIARIVAAVGALAFLVVVIHPYPRTGADRVKHAIDWSAGCERISASTPAAGSGYAALWQGLADRRVMLSCEFAGPDALYVRFKTGADLARALRHRPRGKLLCAYGRELVVDGLDRGFGAMCRRLSGSLIRPPRTHDRAR
jgi:hypothetical protein